MTGVALVLAIFTAAGSLFLVVRGFRSHGLNAARSMRMALAWVAIFILVLGFFSLVDA